MEQTKMQAIKKRATQRTHIQTDKEHTHTRKRGNRQSQIIRHLNMQMPETGNDKVV
jgi:hypothetical protein